MAWPRLPGQAHQEAVTLSWQPQDLTFRGPSTSPPTAVYHLSFDLKGESPEQYAAKHAVATDRITQTEHLHPMGSAYVVATSETAK